MGENQWGRFRNIYAQHISLMIIRTALRLIVKLKEGFCLTPNKLCVIENYC